jgi:hypothetical protein
MANTNQMFGNISVENYIWLFLLWLLFLLLILGLNFLPVKNKTSSDTFRTWMMNVLFFAGSVSVAYHFVKKVLMI